VVTENDGAGAVREVAERERSGERAESAAHSLWSLEFFAANVKIRRGLDLVFTCMHYIAPFA